MGYKCYFCNSDDLRDVRTGFGDSPDTYECPKCGFVNLTNDAADDIPGERFTEKEKQIISICLRNQYESHNRKRLQKQFTLNDLHQIINQYSPLEPLRKNG